MGLALTPQRRAKSVCKEKILTLQKIETKGTDAIVGWGGEFSSVPEPSKGVCYVSVSAHHRGVTQSNERGALLRRSWLPGHDGSRGPGVWATQRPLSFSQGWVSSPLFSKCPAFSH